MNRMFLAALLVVAVIVDRMVFIPEASVWGSIVTYSAVLGFFVWCLRLRTTDELPEMVNACACPNSDPDGSKVVEKTVRRRSDGIG